MENIKDIFEKCMFISSMTDRELIMYKNPVDGNINVFVFLEINHKTANTPYHEFKGKEITSELSILNVTSFSPNSFELRLKEKLIVTVRDAENSWTWVKAENPY